MSLSEELVLKRSKAESLDSVITLNCWGCNLNNVQLLSQLENLEVLNLSCNNLTSLKDLKDCKKLRELFIRCNKLADYSELEHLAALPDLKVLWLSGNPLSEDPSYRSQVARLLPQVIKLDNTDLNPKEDKSGSERSAVLEAVLLLLKELSHSQLETVKDTVATMLKEE